MDEYVSKETVLELLCRECTENCTGGTPYKCYDPCAEWKLIQALPAADVKPVVRGKWLIDDYDIKNFTTVTREATDEDTAPMYCSECHGHAGLNGHEDYVPSNFCPNCGADMRGDTHDE